MREPMLKRDASCMSIVCTRAEHECCINAAAPAESPTNSNRVRAMQPPGLDSCLTPLKPAPQVQTESYPCCIRPSQLPSGPGSQKQHAPAEMVAEVDAFCQLAAHHTQHEAACWVTLSLLISCIAMQLIDRHKSLGRLGWRSTCWSAVWHSSNVAWGCSPAVRGHVPCMMGVVQQCIIPQSATRSGPQACSFELHEIAVVLKHWPPGD